MMFISLSGVWYSSQLATILLCFITFLTNSSVVYYLTYLLILISLIISLYQSLKSSIKTEENSKSINSDNNNEGLSVHNFKDKFIEFINSLKPLIKPAKKHFTTPYIILSISHLIILPKLKISIIPFTIFAIFHSVNYTRTFIISKLPITASFQEKIKLGLEKFNAKYNKDGFKLSVWIQLFTTFYVIVIAIVNLPLNLIGYGSGSNISNIAAVIIYLIFINVMQSENILMKEAINDIIVFADGISADPRVPKEIGQYWNTIKQFCKKKK